MAIKKKQSQRLLADVVEHIKAGYVPVNYQPLLLQLLEDTRYARIAIYVAQLTHSPDYSRTDDDAFIEAAEVFNTSVSTVKRAWKDYGKLAEHLAMTY